MTTDSTEKNSILFSEDTISYGISLGQPRNQRQDGGEIIKVCGTFQFQEEVSKCEDKDPVQIIEGDGSTSGYAPVLCRGVVIGAISRSSAGRVNFSDYDAFIKKIYTIKSLGKRVFTSK